MRPTQQPSQPGLLLLDCSRPHLHDQMNPKSQRCATEIFGRGAHSRLLDTYQGSPPAKLALRHTTRQGPRQAQNSHSRKLDPNCFSTSLYAKILLRHLTLQVHLELTQGKKINPFLLSTPTTCQRNLRSTL